MTHLVAKVLCFPNSHIGREYDICHSVKLLVTDDILIQNIKGGNSVLYTIQNHLNVIKAQCGLIMCDTVYPSRLYHMSKLNYKSKPTPKVSTVPSIFLVSSINPAEVCIQLK